MRNKITITDIANLAGVSKATVSFYLNGKTDKMSEATYNRIKEAIEKTGYKPSSAARSLNSKRSHLIGVIIGDITKPFANQIVKGIDDYVNNQNYLTIVASSEFNPEKERMYVESMIAMGVDGLLVQPTIEFNSMWKQTKSDLPVVFFDSPSSDESPLYVKTNNYDISFEVTNALIDKGYEHFVLISHNPFILKTRLERNQGCIDALDNRNVSYDVIIAENNDFPKYVSKLFNILDNHKNVCIFAFNNSLLQETYAVLDPYIHRIPEIGLIGFDHADWCEYVKPSISTIDQPAYEEGHTAGEILLDSIYRRNNTEKKQVLCSKLVERDTTNLK